MAKAKARLPRPLDHPLRPAAVIMLTLGVVLLVGWPVADEYLDSRAERQAMAVLVAKARSEQSQVSLFETEAEERSAELRRWEGRMIGESDVHGFRAELVEAIRQSPGCRLRKIDVAESTARTWYEKDDPFQNGRRVGKDKEETPYSLGSQSLSLSAAGPLSGLKEFMVRLHTMDRLLHINHLAMHPDDPQRKELVLELELVVFHLKERKEAKG